MSALASALSSLSGWWDCLNRPIVLTGINFAVCSAVGWACVCRLRLTSTDTKVSARFVFSAILTVVTVSGLRAPLTGDQVTGWWPIALTACTWLTLVVNIGSWRDGPPPSMQKDGKQRDSALGSEF